MKGINVPPPSYGPVVWNDDQEPIVEAGGFEDRLHAHMIATMSGDVKRSYGLFLGLAADETIRPRLRDQLLVERVHGRKNPVKRNCRNGSRGCRYVKLLIESQHFCPFRLPWGR